jgi:uncharacterized protein (DUF1330 family)
MPAYMVITREGPIRDAEKMAQYQQINRQSPPKVPLKPLAIYGAIEPLEGDAPDGALLLEFASVADAKAWYNSPEYQAAIPHRQQAADYRMFIVEGI